MTILIVEDNNETLLMLEEFLKEKLEKDISIKTTTRSESALQIANATAIDIFIIDISLPDFDGFKLSINLRKSYKHQPIIIGSAKTDNDYKAYIHSKIHNIAFLTKPYNMESFLTQVKMAIDTSKYLRVQQLKLTYNGITNIYAITNIIYIEKLKKIKKIKVHWRNENSELGSDTYAMSLNQFKKKLDGNNHICQIHRSILLNPFYIAKIDHINNHIILKYLHTSIPFGAAYTETLKYLF